MKYKVIKKFLKPDLYKRIEGLVMHEDFPWRRRAHMVGGTNDPMYFTFNFFSNMAPGSEWYTSHIIPILQQLGAVAPLRVSCHMFINKLFKTSGWHLDNDFSMSKTAVLYLNDCDGGTDLKINNKIISIKAEPNKMLIFDTAISHRSATSTNAPLRYVITLNYFIGKNYEK